MGFLQRLIGAPARTAAPAAEAQRAPAATVAEQNATRRELLRVVLRDVLARHGVPAAWIGSEALATARARESGMHLRLVIKHWEPRLLACTVALQKQIVQRLMLYDPLARHWLMGISWQFALADESACPDMPDPKAWRMGALQAMKTAPDTPAGRQARKADLDRMLAANARPVQAGQQPDFSATQRMFAPTRPAGL